MKAFDFNPDVSAFDYPDDMVEILQYLNAIGTINCPLQKIENYWREYSSDNWDAGWMCVNSVTLSEFARWLSEKELV